MKFGILSLVAAAALAVSAGTASADNFRYRGYRGGYGHAPVYNGFYGGGYGYPRYSSGFGSPGFGYGGYNPGFGISLGRGYEYSPFNYGYNNFYRPYYGGYSTGRYGPYGWRW